MTDGTPHKLARSLSTVARDLQAEQSEQSTLASIVRAAVRTVPCVVYGGITQVQDRQVSAEAATDALVRKCDDAQSELGEGPCMDAI